MSRIVALIDMDCFYAQVEQRLKPELWGKPMAVSQIGTGGGSALMLAITYEARKLGVKKGMSVKEAKNICKELHICQVPNLPNMNKADLSRYKAASGEVFDVLARQPNIILEKASVDEAYLDITEAVNIKLTESAEDIIDYYIANVSELFPHTFVADGEDENIDSDSRIKRIIKWLNEDCKFDSEQLKLAIGAYLVEKIRKEIFTETQFRCSAGIGINKVIAKLVCARHKPNQQTIIPPRFVANVYETTPISSVRNLGGKLGKALVDKFGIKTMADLQMVPKEQVLHEFPEQAEWLFKIMQGDDNEPIRPRLTAKSLAVSKNFPGVYKLRTVSGVEKWIENLSAEFSKRLYEDQFVNKRMAQSFTMSFTNEDDHYTRTVPLNAYSSIGLINNLHSFMRPFNKASDKEVWIPSIKNICMSASKFRDGVEVKTKSIIEWAEKVHKQNLLLVEDKNRPIEINELSATNSNIKLKPTANKKRKMVDYFVNDKNLQPSTSKQAKQLELIELDSDDEVGKEIVSSQDEFRENLNNSRSGSIFTEQKFKEPDISLVERANIMFQYMPKNLKDLHNEDVREILDQLPNDIKEEVLRYCNMNDDREIKARSSQKSQPIKRSRKKSNTNVGKNSDKKISDFFKDKMI